MAPGEVSRPVQFTDVRDLARWINRMLDSATPGTFNTVGPGRDVTLVQVLEACRRAGDEESGGNTGEARVTWADEQFLRDSLTGVTEEERPLWFPEDQIPFDAVDSSKALAAGLSFRPVEETARDTLEWMRFRLRYQDLKAGFSPEFEHGLLQRWREQHP